MVGEISRVDPIDAFAQRLGDLSRRLAEIERVHQRVGRSGFTVVRSTNDAPIASTAVANITFDTMVENGWSTLSGFTTGSTFSVPPNGGGLYLVTGAVFWLTALTFVFVTVTANNLAIATSGTELNDRHYISDVARVNPGDIIRLRVYNASGATITPTATILDAQTKRSPRLSMWRIAP